MAPPPGSSYLVSNAFSRASRRALGLQDPIRIQFRKGWGPENPLFLWFEERFDQVVQLIQLRKEREYPFFHEYIVFILRDGSRYRIDRRQLPDENLPLNSVYSSGVEAYDTIEEISPYYDRLYSSSDCLIEVSFKELPLAFILKICWAIQRNKTARLYTLQRYNCYFFAQTIITCATRSACRWYISTCTGRINESSNKRTRRGSFNSLRSQGSVSSFGAAGFEDYISSFSSDSDSRYSSSSSLGLPIYASVADGVKSPSAFARRTVNTMPGNLHYASPGHLGHFTPPLRTPSWDTLPTSPHRSPYPPGMFIVRPSDPVFLADWESHTDSDEGQQSSTLANLLSLIPDPLHRKLVADKTIWPLLEQLGSSVPDVQLEFDWSDVFEWFSQQDRSPHQLYAAHLRRYHIYPTLPFVHRQLAKALAKFEYSLKNYWGRLASDTLHSIASDTHGFEFGVSVGLWCEDTNVSEQLLRLVDSLAELQDNYGHESWTEFVRGCLQELFKVLERLQLVHKEWSPSTPIRGSHPYSYTSASDVEIHSRYQRHLACQMWVAELLVVFDLEFGELDKALKHQIANAWSKSLSSSLEARVGSFKKRMCIAVTKMPFNKLSRRRHFTHILAQGPSTLQASTHVEMQSLVIRLIKAHSIRVEQYKRWLNLRCTAAKVEADIKKTMGDIWDQITSRASCETCGGIHPFNYDPESVY